MVLNFVTVLLRSTQLVLHMYPRACLDFAPVPVIYCHQHYGSPDSQPEPRYDRPRHRVHFRHSN
jgi:hypothetical protein